MGQKLGYMLEKTQSTKVIDIVSPLRGTKLSEICIFKKPTLKYMMNDTTYSKAEVSGGRLRLGGLCQGSSADLEDRRFTR